MLDSQRRVLLIASADDYLVELEREDAAETWGKANPGGEVVTLNPAPAPDRLFQKLVNRSLFSPTRLIVVPDARPYFKPAEEEESEELAALAEALVALSFSDVSLLLATVSKGEPKGALAAAVRKRGELRFLPLPERPKPWAPPEQRVSAEQRAVLLRVIQLKAPRVAQSPETVDALCELHGFHVRDLVQAAQRLETTDEISAEAVRSQGGGGVCSLRALEEWLVRRDRQYLTKLLATLAAGGELIDWHDEPVESKRLSDVLAANLGRMLRQALACRGHARERGLEHELDPRKCARPQWYSKTFKEDMLPELEESIAKTSDSPLSGLSPWMLHRAFRLGAAYQDRELLEALGALAAARIDHAPKDEALPALSAVLLELLGTGAGARRP